MDTEHVILMIDSSWSMYQYSEKIYKGLRKFIQQLKDSGRNVYVSIVFFSDEPVYFLKSVPIGSIDYMDFSKVRINGVTKLYDSVVNVLTEWSHNMCNKNTLYIISDGEDNSSDEHDEKSAQEVVNQAQNHPAWKVVQCDTETPVLETRNVVQYKLDEIDSLLGNLEGLSL